VDRGPDCTSAPVSAPLIERLYTSRQQGGSYTLLWLPSFSSPKGLSAGVRASLAKTYETDAMPPDMILTNMNTKVVGL